MKFLKGLMAVLCLLSWGAVVSAAVPAQAPGFRITFALPAENLDFSDLDIRDENNQPIQAPQIRQRFEDLLNQSLNRMLIENLTPLRRAYIALLSRELDAFADWLTHPVSAAWKVLSLLPGSPSRIVNVLRVVSECSVPSATPPGSGATNDFASLLFLLLSSTRLLC